jgi:hypothetical protein
MKRVFHTLLVWLAILSMPAQGMALSLMQFCSPSHDRMMRGLQSEGPVQLQGHARGPAGVAAGMFHGQHGHTDHSGHAIAAQAAAVADTGDAPGLMPHHGQFTCSACAACCVALALPTSFEIPTASGLLYSLGLAPMPPIVSHRPDGLERPPRIVLA